MSEQPLDLSKLTLERPSAGPARSPRSRRNWVSRYVLTGGILLGFVALLLAAAGQHLQSRPSVTVVPVFVQRGEIQEAGTSLFQAAGWIEPRPTSVTIAALAPGVIEELLVVEGQHVDKDEPIARLISEDAKLAVEQAKVALSIRQGNLKQVQAEQKAAIARLNQPVHLRARLADAKSLLAKATTEFEQLPFLIKAANANVDFARISLAGKRSAGDAIAGVRVEQAENSHAAAVAKLEELKQRSPNLQSEIDALRDRSEALQAELELLVEEKRQVEEAEAKVMSSEALCEEAKLHLQQAELNLKRTVVRAPIDGRILRLVAFPGTRVMGLEHFSGQSSSSVAEMYDPNRLQVRVDVRLEDVPLVNRGAPVEIETASSDMTIAGRVLQSTSSANIQKNTLEVKVELIDPPVTISPEMLVTATFLAPHLPSSEASPVELMLIPKMLVHTSSDGSMVWTVDANRRVVRKSVELGGAGPDGLVQVTRGLNAMDKLVTSNVENLSDGDAVIISGEDQTIGVGR